MGWLTDLFKDVPLTPELLQKLAAVEAESDALKTDNVILKDDLREAKAQILRLEKKLDHFMHETELDEVDARILQEVALTSEPAAAHLAPRLNLEIGVVDFRLDRLTQTDYVSTWTIGGVERYSLRPKGQEYLIRHNLIS